LLLAFATDTVAVSRSEIRQSQLLDPRQDLKGGALSSQ